MSIQAARQHPEVLTQLEHADLSMPGHMEEASGPPNVSDRLSTNQSCGHKASRRHVLLWLRWCAGKHRQNSKNQLGLGNTHIMDQPHTL